MPELPEVETILNGIKPHLVQQKIKQIKIYHPRLRWDIPQEIVTLLKNKKLETLTRRGKYLLLNFSNGTLIIHLGMSGRLAILENPPTAKKHEHVDFYFSNEICLRYTDPRRFGAILWAGKTPENHPLLKIIGPEPLDADFDAKYLFERSRKKSVGIKIFIMNSKIVSGVGNIYAAESLFAAKIHPLKAAGKLTPEESKDLVVAIKKVLKHAIKQGGTTLKDYKRSDGTPGYFRIELKVYGRAGEPCLRCGTTLKSLRIAGRSTVFCPKCQPLR